MFRRFSFHTPHYFRKHLSKQLTELYASVAILDVALAAVALFEPIYLYQLDYSITQILWFYVIVYGAYFVLAPLGGKFVARFGPERSIALSTPMLVAYYAGLLLLGEWPQLFYFVPIFFALQKTFYWPAYHTDFILTSDQGERGKEFSALWSLSTLMNIIGPVMGGLMITFGGYPLLFGSVIILVLLSNMPLFVEPITHTPTPYSYWRSFRMPFTKRHRRSTIAYLGLGEEFVMQFVWPIFIYVVVKDVLSAGTLVAAATAITVLATLYIGRVVDATKPVRALRWGTWITAAVWAVRPFLRSGPAVLISDTIGRIGKNTTFVAMTAMTYDRAFREKNIIERGVFYEQGFAIGKALTALVIIALASFLPPFTAAFLWAAAVSFLYLVF